MCSTIKPCDTYICVLTESWLNDNDRDYAWLEATDLNKGPLKILTSNRKNHRGGGLALVYAIFQCKMHKEGKLSTFEHAIWKVNAKYTDVTIIGIYHLPYSSSNPFTNGQILDEFIEWLVGVLPSYNNIVICGDFNIQVNNSDVDPEVQNFLETIEVLGLKIQNSFKPTHRSGNTLGLVMAEVLGKLNVLKCKTGPYLSDHYSIMTQVAMERMDVEMQTITYRKVNKIDSDCMSDEIKSDLEGLQHLDLNKMVRNLNSILANSLDKHCQEKTKNYPNQKEEPLV